MTTLVTTIVDPSDSPKTFVANSTREKRRPTRVRNELYTNWTWTLLVASVLLSQQALPANISVTPGVVDAEDDGSCSLVEAINNANNDDQQFGGPGECTAGSGADIIELPAHSTFTIETPADVTVSPPEANGLPPITSEIEIHGNGSIIERSLMPDIEQFRLVKAEAGANLTLQDLTLRHGHAGMRGGGVWSNGASLTLEGVTLRFNQAEFAGGGLYFEDPGELTISNSNIVNNSAGGKFAPLGGGLVIIAANKSVHRILNSTISGNLAKIPNGTFGQGGGMYLSSAFGGMTVVLVNSKVQWNRAAQFGGGVDIDRFVTLAMFGSQISANSANLGGGISIGNSPGTLTVDHSWIFGNEGSSAGGIFSESATVNIRSSTLTRNSATAAEPSILDGVGGGIWYFSTGGNLTVEQSTFVDNNAVVQGGGVYFRSGDSFRVSNSTFARNRSSGGGAISIDRFSKFSWIVNNTMIANDARNGGASLAVSGATNLPSPLDTLANNLMADAASGTECAISFTTINIQSRNLIEDGSCGGELSGDPAIGELAFNYARVQSYLPSAPMIDQGDLSFCAEDDQRGFSRNDKACDIGSVEASNDLLFFGPFEEYAEPPPPGLFLDGFAPEQSALWEVVSGVWQSEPGIYDTEPGEGGVTLLPFELSDYVLEVDVRAISDGGIWVRAIDDGQGEIGPTGVLLVTGGLGGGGQGMYWHIDEGQGLGDVLELNNDLGLNGKDARIRIEVSGDTFAAFVNNNPVAATKLTLSPERFEKYSSGRVGLYDNSNTQKFDGVLIAE